MDKIIEKYRAGLLLEPTKRQKKPSMSHPIAHHKGCFSPTELALWLGLSVRTVERLLKRGEIAYKKVGRRVVIPVSAVEAWLNRKD